jgi:hypothetical protein
MKKRSGSYAHPTPLCGGVGWSIHSPLLSVCSIDDIARLVASNNLMTGWLRVFSSCYIGATLSHRFADSSHALFVTPVAVQTVGTPVMSALVAGTTARRYRFPALSGWFHSAGWRPHPALPGKRSHLWNRKASRAFASITSGCVDQNASCHGTTALQM